MKLPQKFLLSDLLNHNVRCDQGLDHGPGITVWMYPPVHRILGWISRPSAFRLTREVWKLNQLKGIGNQDVYVKGQAGETDQQTIDRFPTLMNADIINNVGERLGLIADLVFEPKSGKIIHYLASRTNPKIPGTSRWILPLSSITDQQPGSISCNISTLDDLPLQKASIRQEFLSKSRKWRSQFQDITFQASDRLEGWLDDQTWNENYNNDDNAIFNENTDSFDKWIDNTDVDTQNKYNKRRNYYSNIEDDTEDDSDPWV